MGNWKRENIKIKYFETEKYEIAKFHLKKNENMKAGCNVFETKFIPTVFDAESLFK